MKLIDFVSVKGYGLRPIADGTLFSRINAAEVFGAVYQVASDGRILAAEPAAAGCDLFRSLNVEKLIATQLPMRHDIRPLSIRAGLEFTGPYLKTVDCPACDGGKNGKCKNCDGEGQVNCECDNCGNEHESDCKSCEGTGKCGNCENGKAEPPIRPGSFGGLLVNNNYMAAGFEWMRDSGEQDELSLARADESILVVTAPSGRFFILMGIRKTGDDAKEFYTGDPK